MAKYILVPSNKKNYEMNYQVPMINIIPGIIWSIPLAQKFLGGFGTLATFGICAAFAMLYVFLTFMPIISILPCVGGAIIYIGMIWSPIGLIDNDIVRIGLKVIVVAFIGLLEFTLVGNATLPWLEGKTDKPVVRKIE